MCYLCDFVWLSVTLLESLDLYVTLSNCECDFVWLNMNSCDSPWHSVTMYDSVCCFPLVSFCLTIFGYNFTIGRLTKLPVDSAMVFVRSWGVPQNNWENLTISGHRFCIAWSYFVMNWPKTCKTWYNFATVGHNILAQLWINWAYLVTNFEYLVITFLKV